MTKPDVQPRGKLRVSPNARALARQALVAGAEARLEPVLTGMARVKWADLDQVGDQSEYVSTCANVLQARHLAPACVHPA